MTTKKGCNPGKQPKKVVETMATLPPIPVDVPGPGDPTREEIAARAAEIRAGWGRMPEVVVQPHCGRGLSYQGSYRIREIEVRD